MRYGVNCNNNGGDGDCEKHLNSDNRVYFPDKRPPQFWDLEHHRIQRPCAAFHVGFAVGLIPHPWNKFENSWCCVLRNGFLLFCLKVTGFEWVGLDCLALREVYRLRDELDWGRRESSWCVWGYKVWVGDDQLRVFTRYQIPDFSRLTSGILN